MVPYVVVAKPKESDRFGLENERAHNRCLLAASCGRAVLSGGIADSHLVGLQMIWDGVILDLGLLDKEGLKLFGHFFWNAIVDAELMAIETDNVRLEGVEWRTVYSMLAVTMFPDVHFQRRQGCLNKDERSMGQLLDGLPCLLKDF